MKNQDRPVLHISPHDVEAACHPDQFTIDTLQAYCITAFEKSQVAFSAEQRVVATAAFPKWVEPPVKPSGLTAKDHNVTRPNYMALKRAARSVATGEPFIGKSEKEYTEVILESARAVIAIQHAATYRTRYAEFLRIDFARIPFPELSDDFEKLSKLGWALVQAHLLRELPRKGVATYNGKGDHTVEAVRYSPQEKAVSINKTQFFKPVPQDVWGFHIGGYQVLDKYLKSRKGRALSLDEINHVGAIADSVAFTIEQMAKIDKAYQTAFAERG